MANRLTNTAEQIHFAGDLPLLPLRDIVLFPGTVVPFDVGRAKTVLLAEHLATQEQPLVAVFTQKSAETEDPGESELHDVGTLARVLGAVKGPGGSYSLILEGVVRGRLRGMASRLLEDSGTCGKARPAAKTQLQTSKIFF